MIALLLCAALGADPIVVPPPVALPPPPVTGAGSSGQAAVVALVREGRVYSGVLISDLGLVLTTARVFGKVGLPASAVLLDGRTLDAKVEVVDPGRDLAMLRLPRGAVYPSAPLAVALPEVGGPIQVVSQPAVVSWTASSGTLTSPFAMREGRADPLFFGVKLVTPAQGEGGAVFDDQGRVVGILASASGTGTEWAVGIDALRLFAEHLVGINEFTLEVGAEPSGTRVTVDSRPVGETGVAPLAVRNLASGSHEVQLKAAGAADDILHVELLQHQVVSLQRRLDPGGQVELAANARAQVWVDGAARGQVPLFLTLPSGSHRIDLRATGFLPQTQQVEVVLGTRRAVTFELPPVLAQLSVNSTPEGAVVTVNETEVGRTPLVAAQVPAGSVEVSIRYPERHSYRFKLTLSPHEVRDLGTYRLEEPFGWLEPKALPEGTQVAIDAGQRHVMQPYERVPVGDHRVEVLAPAYYAYSERVSLADAQTAVLDPPLRLYDRLAPRRVAAGVTGGLGIALGLVAIGFATDGTTSKAAPATAMVGLAGIGAAIYLLVTSPPTDEAGWGEHQAYAPAGSTP